MHFRFCCTPLGQAQNIASPLPSKQYFEMLKLPSQVFFKCLHPCVLLVCGEIGQAVGGVCYVCILLWTFLRNPSGCQVV